MVLARRQLAVTISLGKGKYGDSGFDTVKFDGPLRASAQILITGFESMAQLDLTIYGLTLSHMNQVATLGPLRNVEEAVRNNQVLVEAGDTDGGLGVVYHGVIQQAYHDFSSMPECSFRIQAGVGVMEAVRPVPPTSYNGLVDVATIFGSLAKQAGMAFENSGVTLQLIDPYYPGTIRDQMAACARAVDINWFFDEKTRTVAIWPKNSDRGGFVPVISPKTGLKGYPSFTTMGIEGDCLYNPTIAIGQTIKIESDLKATRSGALQGATGLWTINWLRHYLESETPGGNWFSHFHAVSNKNAVAVGKG